MPIIRFTVLNTCHLHVARANSANNDLIAAMVMAIEIRSAATGVQNVTVRRLIEVMIIVVDQFEHSDVTNYPHHQFAYEEKTETVREVFQTIIAPLEVVILSQLFMIDTASSNSASYPEQIMPG